MGQQRAGEQIGVTGTTIWQVENGRGCNVRTLIQILEWIESK